MREEALERNDKCSQTSSELTLLSHAYETFVLLMSEDSKTFCLLPSNLAIPYT